MYDDLKCIIRLRCTRVIFSIKSSRSFYLLKCCNSKAIEKVHKLGLTNTLEYSRTIDLGLNTVPEHYINT